MSAGSLAAFRVSGEYPEPKFVRRVLGRAGFSLRRGTGRFLPEKVEGEEERGSVSVERVVSDFRGQPFLIDVARTDMARFMVVLLNATETVSGQEIILRLVVLQGRDQLPCGGMVPRALRVVWQAPEGATIESVQTQVAYPFPARVRSEVPFAQSVDVPGEHLILPVVIRGRDLSRLSFQAAVRFMHMAEEGPSPVWRVRCELSLPRFPKLEDWGGAGRALTTARNVERELSSVELQNWPPTHLGSAYYEDSDEEEAGGDHVLL